MGDFLNREKGSVLLWVIVIILFISIFISISNLKFSIFYDLISKTAEKNKKSIILHNFMEKFKYLILTSYSNGIELTKPSGEPYYPHLYLDGRELFFDKDLNLTTQKTPFSVKIYDVEGFLSLSYRMRENLINYTRQSLNVDSLKAIKIIESIFDWIDSDKFNRLNGGEYFFLNGERKEVPSRGIIISSDEIFYIEPLKDISKEKIRKFLKYLNWQIRYDFINLNTSPYEVVASFPGINDFDVRTLLKRRESYYFKTVEDLSYFSGFDFTPYKGIVKLFPAFDFQLELKAKLTTGDYLVIISRMRRYERKFYEEEGNQGSQRREIQDFIENYYYKEFKISK